MQFQRSVPCLLAVLDLNELMEEARLPECQDMESRVSRAKLSNRASAGVVSPCDLSISGKRLGLEPRDGGMLDLWGLRSKP